MAPVFRPTAWANPAHIPEDFLHSLLDFGDMTRIPPAHHDHVIPGGHGIPQIIHQGSDTGIGGEFATKSREFHGSIQSGLTNGFNIKCSADRRVV